MQINTQWISTYFYSTVNIDTLSYQNVYYLYYCNIHIKSYIHWCCPLTYEYFLIFLFLLLNCHSPLFFTNIKYVPLWYFLTQHDRNSQRNPKTLIPINNNKWGQQIPITPTQITLNDRALYGVRWSWWGRSWLRRELPGFR